MLTACQEERKAEGQSKPLTQTQNRTAGILNEKNSEESPSELDSLVLRLFIKHQRPSDSLLSQTS